MKEDKGRTFWDFLHHNTNILVILVILVTTIVTTMFVLFTYTLNDVEIGNVKFEKRQEREIQELNKIIQKQERDLYFLEQELKETKTQLENEITNGSKTHGNGTNVKGYQDRINILEKEVKELKTNLKSNENKRNTIPKNKKERAEQRKILDQIRREKIIDNTLESLRGNLAFYVPDKMKWDETYKVYVGVSKDSAEVVSTQIIEKGQLPYRKNKIEMSEVKTDTIPLWIEMYAELLDPTNKNSFRISPTGKLYEKIDVGGLNVDIWEWDVTPISFDTSYLQLNIFRATQKDNYELVFNSTEKIIIQSTIWDRIFEFLKNNWQYIISAICIPFFVWIVKRFTDKEKNKKET